MGQFAQIPNETARDDRLSYLARGLLAEALTHGEGWRHEGYKETRARARKARGKRAESRDAIQAGYAELDAHGYRHRVWRRGEGGRMGKTEIRVYPVPTACGDPGCVTCPDRDPAAGATCGNVISSQVAPEARDSGPPVPPGQTGSFRRSQRKPGTPGRRSSGPLTEDHPAEHQPEDHAEHQHAVAAGLRPPSTSRAPAGRANGADPKTFTAEQRRQDIRTRIDERVASGCTPADLAGLLRDGLPAAAAFYGTDELTLRRDLRAIGAI